MAKTTHTGRMARLLTKVFIGFSLGIGIILVSVLVLFSKGGGQKQEPIPLATNAESEKVELPLPLARKESERILFVGDVMLGRAVEALMKKHGEDYPFALIEDTLAAADFVVGNLEGPIPEKHSQTPDASLRFSFPKMTAALIEKHNFRAVSVANNHAYDAGQMGFEQTQANLGAANVLGFGDPRMKMSGCRFVPEVELQIVLCAYSIFSGFNETKALEDIRQTRAEFPGAYLVLIPHWGNEYQKVASKEQERLAHLFIENGIDVVVGSHPHVVQNVELYHDRPIFYSLGNFIFDQYFSKETQEGLAINTVLTSREVELNLIPLKSQRSQPREMEDGQAQPFLDDLAQRSPTVASAIREKTLRLKR